MGAPSGTNDSTLIHTWLHCTFQGSTLKGERQTFQCKVAALSFGMCCRDEFLLRTVELSTAVIVNLAQNKPGDWFLISERYGTTSGYSLSSLIIGFLGGFWGAHSWPNFWWLSNRGPKYDPSMFRVKSGWWWKLCLATHKKNVRVCESYLALSYWEEDHPVDET